MGEAKIDLEKGVYVLGEEVTGTASFYLKKPVPQRGAALSLIGKERTEVNYTTPGPKGNQSRTAVEESEFLHQEFPLLPLPVDEKGKFEPGDYNFPFTFKLPVSGPITYRGRHAKISYQITAKIDVPLGLDIRESIELEVISTTKNPKREPVSAASSSWNIDYEPRLNFTLERSGYTRGETVSGSLAFNNPESKNVRKADVTLKWIETARAQGHVASTEVLKQVAEVSIGSRVAKGEASFGITVPQNAPLTFASSLCGVGCELKVNMDISMGSDIAASRNIEVLGGQFLEENLPSYPRERASVAAGSIPESPAGEFRGSSQYCPYCGGVLTNPNSKFCPHCGAKMP